MSQQLFKLKLTRLEWVAMLKQRRIQDAVFCFENYIRRLDNCFQSEKNEEILDEVRAEMRTACSIYYTLLTKIAQDYFSKRDYDNAVICYVELFQKKVFEPQMIANFVTCIDSLEMYDLEAELIEFTESLPAFKASEFYYKISDKFSNMNNLPEAIKYRKKALLCKPKLTVHDYNNIGDLYNRYYSVHTADTRCALKSLACFKKASNMEPTVRVFAKNATIMAGKVNRFKEYSFFWERMLKIGNMTYDDKFDYACYCLKMKNVYGWYEYSDARFKKENNKTIFPTLKRPYWNGRKDISDSVLLVHYEQGFGDSILFSGYLSRIREKAQKVIFIVQRELVSLIQRSFPDIEVLGNTTTNPDKLSYDCYVPAMSIPKVLNIPFDEISVGSHYLKSNKERIEYFKNKHFNNDKFKIGISFSGNNTGNKTRDIPIEAFLMLEELDNVELYSFTKDLPTNAFVKFEKNKVHNIAEEFGNFDDTAAAMENCDLIITADNVILNLAGALGKKTFALFNWSYEFRWFDLTGDNVGWYTTVKPFVNTTMDDWSSSMRKAVEEIKTLV